MSPKTSWTVRRGLSWVEVHFPYRLVMFGNARLHWRAKANAVKKAREAAYLLVMAALRPEERTMPKTGMRVTLTRFAPSGRLPDLHDGIPSAFKPMVDAIAEAFRVDDGDPLWSWAYARERGEYAVQICFEPRDE